MDAASWRDDVGGRLHVDMRCLRLGTTAAITASAIAASTVTSIAAACAAITASILANLTLLR